MIDQIFRELRKQTSYFLNKEYKDVYQLLPYLQRDGRYPYTFFDDGTITIEVDDMLYGVEKITFDQLNSILHLKTGDEVYITGDNIVTYVNNNFTYNGVLFKFVSYCYEVKTLTLSLDNVVYRFTARDYMYQNELKSGGLLPFYNVWLNDIDITDWYYSKQLSFPLSDKEVYECILRNGIAHKSN